MKLKNFVFVLSFVFLFSFCNLVFSSSTSNTVLWQGFEHHWERRALDVVDTPHRMGSIANYILNEDFTNSTSTFQVNQTFTPGVNGDYSYPKTYFSLINQVGVLEGEHNFQVRDQSTEGDNPSSNINITLSIFITLPESGLSINNVDMLLRGWRIDMVCNPDEQPEGDICNSNGIWPYNLQINYDNCALSGVSLQCTLLFTLERSCDPSCAYGSKLGIDKAYNHVMDYNITTYYSVLYSNNINFIPLSPIIFDKITSEGNEYGTITSDVSNGYTSATVGMRGFGFKLSPLLDDSIFEGKPGRYLESLTFKLKDVLYSENTNSFAFDYEMGYYTPLTTFPSNGTFSINPTIIQFNNTASTEITNYSPASGAICVSDKFFKCEFNIDGVKLRETTNSLVTVNIE